MTVDTWVRSVHAFVTVAMTGLIWFVQVVHYPLFAAVGESGFRAYESRHAVLTTRVVAPLMLAEVAAALWLLASRPSTVTIAGAVLLAGIWLSTAALQVPCHRRLAGGWDAAVAARLVATNWIRTAAWTARGLLAMALLGGASG